MCPIKNAEICGEKFNTSIVQSLRSKECYGSVCFELVLYSVLSFYMYCIIVIIPVM